MMAVNVESDSSFSAGIPRALFSTAESAGNLGYSVSPDGQRFLMSKQVTGTASAGVAEQMSLVVVENWFDDPARLLEGTGKRMRHVKLRLGKEPDPTALAALIENAYCDMLERLRAGAL